MKTIVHPPHSLPVMSFNNGFKEFHAFCTNVKEMKNETVEDFSQCTVTAEETKDFMSSLRDVLRQSYQTDDKKCIRRFTKF